jgi:hypothetical protein
MPQQPAHALFDKSCAPPDIGEEEDTKNTNKDTRTRTTTTLAATAVLGADGRSGRRLRV